jgi:primase-polymerase (primpol)-like protein
MTEISKEVKKPKPFFNPNPHAYASEMKEYDQWIFSKLKMNPDGTWSKPPCNASGYYTDGTEKNNWLSFKEAFEICEANPGKLSGIGFCVSSSCPIKAIDDDHIYDPITGEWNQQAWEELRIFNTRVEWSPSHTGVHVFFESPIMLENGKKTQPDGTGREMYFEKHYLTVTGEVVEGFPTTINEVEPELITQSHEKWFPGKRTSIKADIRTFEIPDHWHDIVPEEFVNDPDDPLKDLSPTKDQVINLCRNAPHGFGEKFDKIFTGNISKYESKSEADMAIAGMIAFHTSDYSIIREIIQESKFWDEKWERDDYCQRTIMKAIRNRWGRY